MHSMSVRRRSSGPGLVADGSDPGPPVAGAAPQRPPPSPTRSLEAELAERLDTVLGIAERMAASHDRKDLFRTIVDETKRVLRADCVTIRVLVDDRLVVAAWAGMPDDVAAALPVLADRGELGRRGGADGPRGRLVRRPRRSATWVGAVRRHPRVRRRPDRAAHPPRRRHRDPVGHDPGAAVLDRGRHRLRHDARDPRRHRALQCRAVRADRGARRPARRAPGRLRPAQPRLDGRRGRSHRRRGDAPDHRLPQRPGLSHRTARPGRADRLRRPRRRVRHGRHGAAPLPARRGVHRLGGAARRAVDRARRQPRPAWPDDRRARTTSTSR